MFEFKLKVNEKYFFRVFRKDNLLKFVSLEYNELFVRVLEQREYPTIFNAYVAIGSIARVD
jgi:hypothetical protein